MLNKQNIKNKLINQKERLKSYGIRQIGLFGSYVRNEQTSDSDIDLLVDFNPEKETFDNFMSVSDLLEKIFKGYKVEIVTKNGLSKYIGPYILKEIEYV